jgi:hypothetical protein
LTILVILQHRREIRETGFASVAAAASSGPTADSLSGHGARALVQRKSVQVPESLRGAIALAAAYALVLQTLLFAFGWCPQAIAGPAPGFICSQASHQAPGQPAAPDAPCPCCAMACCSAVALTDRPSDHVLSPPAFPTRATVSTVAQRAAHESFALILPVGARAPPRLG